MSSKKAFKQARRGGRRENAGRKAIWKNKDTITIRVPKLIATQVLELAHKLDSEEKIELDTESKSAENNLMIQAKLRSDEIITKSKWQDQETEYDFVMDSKELGKTEIITESKISEYEALKIAILELLICKYTGLLLILPDSYHLGKKLGCPQIILT